MGNDYPRSQRVGDQIQRELAELIRAEVRDPRVRQVTVSEVEVSRDLAHANVYVTGLGMAAEDSRAMATVLDGAAGFLRRQLARRLRLRTVPALHFHYDPVFDRGARLNELIEQAVSGDGASGAEQD